jgi:hypothetical protein
LFVALRWLTCQVIFSESLRNNDQLAWPPLGREEHCQG